MTDPADYQHVLALGIDPDGVGRVQPLEALRVVDQRGRQRRLGCRLFVGRWVGFRRKRRFLGRFGLLRGGLLVSRFSGNADPISGDFSGVAKAAYLIKDGKIERAVAGTLIAGNVFEALKTLSGISREQESVFNYTLPYLRLEGISITAE